MTDVDYFEEALQRLKKASKRPSSRKENKAERMHPLAYAHAVEFLEQYQSRQPPFFPRVGVGRGGSASFVWNGWAIKMRLDIRSDGGYDFHLTDYGHKMHGSGQKADFRIAARVARLAEGERFTCVECTVDTSDIGEYYMVHDHVWMQAKLDGTDGMLCIGCLEKRIGRRLDYSDFTDAPINWPAALGGDKSQRLRERLGHADHLEKSL